MIKKIFASFVIVLVLIGFLDIDLTRLTDTVWEAAFPPEKRNISVNEQAAPSAALTVGGKGVSMGDTLDTVIGTFGDGMDTLVSEYGFLWYIYHSNYEDYIQIGIQNGEVAGVYTNSPALRINGITLGASPDEVCTAFGEPLAFIVKDNTRFVQNRFIDGKHETDTFEYQNMYVTFFYDVFENNTVTSVNIIEMGTEQAFKTSYPAPSDELKHSYEKQNFYAANARRVRDGLPAFIWNDRIASVAVKHSADMADNHYFDHVSPGGQSALERAQEARVQLSVVAENIASGAQNSIMMHELLMNSEGHRVNLLSDFKYLGVGVWFNGENRPYLTQNFFNPPKIVLG
jgi:uncharacterized protein YkwD